MPDIRSLFLVLAVVLTLVSLPQIEALCNLRGDDAPPAPLEWNWVSYPNPNSPNQDQQVQCCRSKQSSVCDPNGLIPQATADDLDVDIENVYTDTRCGCDHCTNHNHGYVIRVALLEKMIPIRLTARDNGTMARLRDAHLYAYQISRKWNMDGACQEAILILYSKQDNILFTLTRSEARRKLSDTDIGEVSLKVRHYFDNERTIGDGIKEMIERYKRILSRDEPEVIRFSSK